MIGILVTGHGRFATGVTSALELVLGKQECFEAVDFPDGETKTELEQHMDEALGRLAETEHILAFCDILSGSPFNTLIDRAMRRGGITVYYGTNVGMLLDTTLNRNFGSSLKELTADIVDKGRRQVGRFEADSVKQDDDSF
ncbi:MAG: PTS sugar transporter subunit IIA [Enterocloster asparagiformis]|nr:PTS sugar transporter subunit IIA [Enterocloster asparagiformis]